MTKPALTRRRAATWLLPAAALLMLGGCLSADPTDGLALAAYAPAQGSAEGSAGAARALVTLPAAAGRVLSVTDKSGSETSTQRIVLDGDGGHPGENAITIERGGTDGVAAHLLRPPSADMLAAEMRRGQADLGLHPAGTTETNAHGPFGYAFTKIDGGACLYAWQWLDGKRSAGIGFQRVRPVSIRVRLCRTAPLAELVALVRQLVVHADGAALTASPVGVTGTGAPDALQLAGAGLGLSVPAPRETKAEPERRTAAAERRATVSRPRRQAAARPRSSLPVAAPADSQPVVPPAPAVAAPEGDALRKVRTVAASDPRQAADPVIPMP